MSKKSSSSRAVKTKSKKSAALGSVQSEKPLDNSASLRVEKPEKTYKPKSSRSAGDVFARLYKWNLALAALHFVQAVLVLLLSTERTLPITTKFLAIDPLGSSQGGMPALTQASRTLFHLNLAHLIIAFFLMSAVAHLVVATVYRKRYEADLQDGINRARWIEYSFSASTMMIAIGLLVGVNDVASLLMLFGLTAVMNLLGLIMEVVSQKGQKPNWLTFTVGCIAGALPWLTIGLYLLHGALYGSKAPTFVYFIFVSIFVFFMSFALNMYLQYRKTGKWANYLYGERVYMILSLVAKSALAWQVFAGTLRP